MRDVGVGIFFKMFFSFLPNPIKTLAALRLPTGYGISLCCAHLLPLLMRFYAFCYQGPNLTDSLGNVQYTKF